MGCYCYYSVKVSIVYLICYSDGVWTVIVNIVYTFNAKVSYHTGRGIFARARFNYAYA